MNNFIKYFSWVAAIVAAWFGNLPQVMQILLICMGLDILTGAARAIINKELSSRVALSGVGKKAIILIVIGLVYAVSDLIVTSSFAAPLSQAVTGFYIYVEIISILENASASGVPIPEFLKKALEKLKPQES